MSHPELTKQPVIPTGHRSLINRSFLGIWIGQFISSLGNGVYGLALIWEMKLLTGSTVMMATVGMAEMIPAMILGIFAGVLVDRWSKKKAMICSDLIRGLIVGIVTLLLAIGYLRPWEIVVSGALTSVAASVFGPAYGSIYRLVAGKENLQKANSMNQVSSVISGMLGPGLAGILIAHLSMYTLFVFNSLSFFVSVMGLLLVFYVEPERVKVPLNIRRFGSELREGIVAIFAIPTLKNAIPLGLFMNFIFAPIDIVMIQYCTKVLHGGSQLFGLFGSCFSAGLLLGAFVPGYLLKFLKKGYLVVYSLTFIAALMIALSLTQNTAVMLLSAILFGISLVAVSVTVNTSIQLSIPEDKMGRVFGALGIANQGVSPVSLALSGYVLSILSVPVVLLVMGVLQLGSSSYALCNRVIRKLD